MKGVIFTELLEMVESTYSATTVDKIIAASDLAQRGAYTSIGTYPSAELGRLLVALSREVGTPVGVLLRWFGRMLFGRFRAHYPMFFEGHGDALSFLESVENVIHVEVKKLYPEAELPRFDVQRIEPGALELVYRSERGLADFAVGLIEGCGDHFAERLTVAEEDLSEGRKTAVRFVVRSLGSAAQVGG